MESNVPVARVTLLEDRGLVQRRGVVSIPPGRSQLAIEGVAPVLVDKTVAAEVRGPAGQVLPAGVRVGDVVIDRWRVASDTERDADVVDVHTKIQDAERVHTAADRALALLKSERMSLTALVEISAKELAEDVAWGREDVAAGVEAIDALEAKIAAVGTKICAAAHEAEVLERTLVDLRTLAAATRPPDADARARLTVEVFNPTDAATTATLVVDYLVPGAVWRPCHTARLTEAEDGSNTVTLQTEGCVWQATGEDWNDVELIFSTERPSLGVAPPELSTETLRARKRGSQVQVAAREQAVSTAGLGQDESPSEAEDELPGIDDGGEALRLQARSPVTVPADGRPHRVPLAEFTTAAETTLMCVPELASAVLLRSRQTNAGSQPLLAGPVDLVRASGHVGRTSVLYIAAGERFDLGWGPDLSLRVHREVEHLEQTRRSLSSWTRKPRRVRVKLSNVGSTPARVQVKERIATSEIEKVEVELDSASQQATADPDGFVTWSVALRGFGRETVQVEWTLVVHDDVAGI